MDSSGQVTSQAKRWDNIIILQVVTMDGSSLNGTAKLNNVCNFHFRFLCHTVGDQWDIWIRRPSWRHMFDLAAEEFEIENAVRKAARDAALEGVSEEVPNSIAPDGAADTSTTIKDIDSEGAAVILSAGTSIKPFDKVAEFHPIYPEMSLSICITACLPRLHPSLTLCIWNSILSCFISKVFSSHSDVRVVKAGMPEHKSKAQVMLLPSRVLSDSANNPIASDRIANTSTTIYDVDSEGAEATSSATASDNPFNEDAKFCTLHALSIAKLSIAPLTTLPLKSTCEGALGKLMASEGANETEACSLISIFIHFATSIKFFWYLFMDPGPKVGFRTIVREYRGNPRAKQSNRIALAYQSVIESRDALRIPSIVHSNNGFDSTLLFFLEQ